MRSNGQAVSGQSNGGARQAISGLDQRLRSGHCLAGATRVLLVDGRTRPITELTGGDVVVGTERVGGVRRYTATHVLEQWSTTQPAYAVRLADGTELVAGAEHRFLTEHGWRHVSGGWCRGGRRAHLRPGSALLGPGPFGPVRSGSSSAMDDPEYRHGYLCGLVRGDGEGFPSDRLGLEALGRAHHLLAEARPAPIVVGAEPGRIALLSPRPGLRRGPIAPVADVAAWPRGASEGWCAGFLAGVIDARGTVTAGELRVAHDDEAVVGRVAGALHRLGFEFAMGAPTGGRRVVCLAGGTGAWPRLAARISPAVSRGLDGAAVEATPELAVVSVRALGRELPMYDITTATGDFVAEGVVSH